MVSLIAIRIALRLPRDRQTGSSPIIIKKFSTSVNKIHLPNVDNCPQILFITYCYMCMKFSEAYVQMK